MNNLTAVRAVGWIATVALVCAALVAPATTFANTGNQSGDGVAWDNADFRGSESECEGVELEEGQVFWHFVQTRVAAGTASGMLTATFEEAGTIVSGSYKESGSVLHWGIVTGEDTLDTFSSDVTSAGPLNLSHICANPSVTPSDAPTDAPSDAVPTETPTEAPTTAPTTAPTEAPTTAPTEAPTTAPTEAPTTAPTEAPTTAPTEAPTTAPTEAPTTAPTAAATPTGQVQGETATPRITPPATDSAVAPATGTTGSGWTPLMLIAAGLLALTLVLMPATRRTKR
jgi:hypothetical protein